MQTQNHQDSEATYGGQSFKPREWDPKAREPEAAAGKYRIRIASAKFRTTKPEQGSDPSINMQLKILEAYENIEANQKSVGGVVWSSIVFFAPGSNSKRSNAEKRRYEELLEACELNADIMPRAIKSEEDFSELLGALQDQEVDVWITHTPRKEGEGVWVNVAFVEPRGYVSASADVEEEEVEEEVRRPAARSTTNGKSSAKNGKKPARR